MRKHNQPFPGLAVTPVGNLAEADVFFLLGFGLVQQANGRLQPGQSNLALARWLLANNPHRVPTITQEGTFLALQQLENAHGSLELEQWVINLPHDARIHVDTFGAALQIWLICNNAGLRRGALVTHPWQMARAERIFRKLPLEQLIIPVLPPMPFEPNSSQIWTRNKLLYLLYEFGMARPIGRLFGWL